MPSPQPFYLSSEPSSAVQSLNDGSLTEETPQNEAGETT